ncbi:Leucine-rich repeat-containing protein 40 [Takifugu flavidus]|uniref:Leucine-rich repeat-containing protein 40 n=1 Tax=Takifugu flavidus TaxID=433684 RepID=A0A5C6MQ25_9TELE|nr:Leucine-rich repeat-containing protein 40 [Takifugu flavidus]
MSRFKKTDKVDFLAGFRTEKPEPTVPNGLLNAARKSGQLNLSGRGLIEVPQNVYRINCDVPEEAKQTVFSGDSDRWWEQTDLTKLLLASNQLTQLSDDIRLLPALTVLDLDDNQLSCLPEALQELQELQQLRLSHNQLTSLPAWVANLKNLASLALQFNLLVSLPEELGHLKSLIELDLSNNQLKDLPANVGCLTCLQKLNLSHNKLSWLPDSIGQLTKVKMLDCSNNQLTEVPASLSQMSALEQLYLRHNKLDLLPNLKSPVLKDLYFGNNQIEQLEPEQLSSLTAISVLELRDNKIRSLPEEITLLSSLTRLDLTNNDISSLPASLGLLSHLKVVLLEGNPLRGLRRDLLTVGDSISTAKGTTELLKYLRGRITESSAASAAEEPTAMTLPSQAKVNFHNIQTLKMLQYSEKQTAAIPDEVFDAAVNQGVTAVNFSKNLLTSIPPRLLEFQSSLSDINLGFNRLAGCDPICSLLQLTHIDLSLWFVLLPPTQPSPNVICYYRNNQMAELPAEMKNLTKLRSIILNYNRFKSFPGVLYQIVSLETILLGNNQVDGVDPSHLMKLSHLSTLDLSNNDLLKIPPELGLCTSLRCLSLEGNPFRAPRAAIVAKGTDAVMEYLRSRIPA